MALRHYHHKGREQRWAGPGGELAPKVGVERLPLEPQPASTLIFLPVSVIEHASAVTRQQVAQGATEM